VRAVERVDLGIPAGAGLGVGLAARVGLKLRGRVRGCRVGLRLDFGARVVGGPRPLQSWNLRLVAWRRLLRRAADAQEGQRDH